MKLELCPPLTGNWTQPGSKLKFSTTNNTVGTLVRVSCDQLYSTSGASDAVSRILHCREDGNWNGTLPPCPVIQTSLENTGSRPLSTEVIVIWSIGGAMLLFLICLLIAIICAKKKELRSDTGPSPQQRPVSTIGLQNPGFVSIMDQMNHHCIITGGDGCHRVTYPMAPPPYPGSLPRGASANANTNQSEPAQDSATAQPSSAPAQEHINSLPRPQPESSRTESRDTGRHSVPAPLPQNSDSRRQVPEPSRAARPRDQTSLPSYRAATAAPRSTTTSGNPNRIQGRQSRINSQPRRLAPAHMAVPVTDIMDPPPPYTPYPDYDFPNCLRQQRNAGARRQPERLQSLYI